MEIFNEKVTRQELIDFIVLKKIEPLKEEIDLLKLRIQELNSKKDNFENLVMEEFHNASEKFIKTQPHYRGIIADMEKDFNASPISLDPWNPYSIKNSKLSNYFIDYLANLINFDKSSVLLIFLGETSKNTELMFDSRMRYSGGFFGPAGRDYWKDFPELLSYIKIPKSKISSPKYKKVLEKLNLLNDELAAIRKRVEQLRKEIESIKSDSHKIKDALVEEILSSTEEGRALLGKINSIEITGQTLQIG